MKQRTRVWISVMVVIGIAVCGLSAQAAAADKPFVFGMLLVGPYNDHGWSQAHYDGGGTWKKTFRTHA
jgi:simple sugar transport system substrate-binding protein